MRKGVNEKRCKIHCLPFAKYIYSHGPNLPRCIRCVNKQMVTIYIR